MNDSEPTDRNRDMHPDVEAMHRAIQSLDDQVVALRAAVETMTQQIAPTTLRSVIVASIREAASDQTILYDAMTRHARRSLAQYVGERVLTAFAVLAISAVLAWSYITGHVK
jgi:hypothetical protein